MKTKLKPGTRLYRCVWSGSPSPRSLYRVGDVLVGYPQGCSEGFKAIDAVVYPTETYANTRRQNLKNLRIGLHDLLPLDGGVWRWEEVIEEENNHTTGRVQSTEAVKDIVEWAGAAGKRVMELEKQIEEMRDIELPCMRPNPVGKGNYSVANAARNQVLREVMVYLESRGFKVNIKMED